MALNPGYSEQQLLAGARASKTRRLSAPERRAQAVLGGLYVLAAAVALVAAPIHLATLSPVVVLTSLLALAVAVATEFETDSGVTAPTQLGFVPLLFALPPALVPIAVPVGYALAKLPDVVRGRMRPVRLLACVQNSWFALGPVAVLSLAGSDASAPILVAAFLSQFAVDFAASAVREWLARGASLREQVGELWVYGIDAALTPVGLLAVWATAKTEWAAAALLPLLGVLGVFARERRRRVDSLVELNGAYQAWRSSSARSWSTTTATPGSTAARS